MANFPDNPVIGEVYVVDGVTMLCTGVKRFKPIPEHTTFATVAAMTAGVVPVNHRCAAVRYSASGKVVPGLSYISRGIGWPVTADGFVNHSDSKGNFLELQLTNNTISLAHTGADSTGVADSAPHLRAAMASLGQNGGGTLVIPKGTFYLNSGDPRGLKIAGTPDFYTVCEIVNNVTVKGYGEESVLKYNSNRLGVVPATGKGDVGAIFANFRVRAATTTPYACSNFNVQSFKVEYTTLSNQSVDFIDGQLVRVYSLSGSVINGVFAADDINVSSAPGHQVFSYERVDKFSSSRCRFYGSGKLTNSANTDVSLYYVTGTIADIRGNYSSGSTAAGDNSTFIELHTTFSSVTDNTCAGMNTFMNAVSQVTHPGAAYDFSEFRVENNHVRDIRNFIVDWVAASNRKTLIHAKNNDIILRARASNDVETLLRHAAISGTSDLPTEKIIFENNSVQVSVSGAGAGAVQYSTSFDGLVRHEYVNDLRFANNQVTGARRGIITADGTKMQKLTVVDNELEFGYFGNDTNDDSARVSRTGITVNFQSSTALQRVIASGNIFTSLYGGAQLNHGLFMLNSGGTVSAAVEVRDNAVRNTVGEELAAIVYGGSSHASNSIKIQHVANKLANSAALAGMFPAVGLTALVPGSKVSFENYDVIVANVGASKEFIVFGRANAAPTSGYFSVGSFIHNTGPGVLGWKCDVAGTPGTWVAKA